MNINEIIPTKISTVAEVIAALSELPQDLPCFFRPKYSGPVEYTQNVGIMAHNISEMHPNKNLYPNEPEKYVCFLV